ncbi:uncharacterized protein LOC121683515 isoform X2 [Alosa sapidissima]|uniref:uncharacterized protein LOC121683515 isoform X2 n=1 Tax=Alosa sapidissima TaxID=34773 RepID=UPI001C0A3A21|nr:uncharacterized protein LOC121683515 isoform X2 [Alosa sapidissima]
MEKLVQKLDALIATPRAGHEPNKRILQFTFVKDTFIIPDDPRGKEEPDISTLFLSKKNINKPSVKKLVQDFLPKWEACSRIILDFKELDRFSEEPGNDDLPLVTLGNETIRAYGGILYINIVNKPFNLRKPNTKLLYWVIFDDRKRELIDQRRQWVILAQQSQLTFEHLNTFHSQLWFQLLHCRLHWVILDARKLALSHGRDLVYSYRGIAMAVQYFWNMNQTHTNIIVCAPEWMKMKQCRSVEATGLLNESALNYFPSKETHYLFGLQDHLQDLLIFIPSGASELCFMEALAKRIDGLIVTQLDEDTFTGISNKRILQFIFNDTFILPKNPKGKDGRDLQTILQSNSVDKVDAVKEKIDQLKTFWKDYSSIRNEPIDSDFYTSEDHNPQRVIIDGGNVAKTHGLDIVFSWRGIFLAVQHFWGKGHHDIKVYVSTWRKFSKYTMDEYKLQDRLKYYCHIVYADSTTDDDCLMLDDAKTNNGWIVTNDEFRNYKQQRKDMKNRCIRYEFVRNQFVITNMDSGSSVPRHALILAPHHTRVQAPRHSAVPALALSSGFQGNHIQVPPNSCQALDYSDTDEQVVFDHDEWLIDTQSTKEAVDTIDTDATIVHNQTEWSMPTHSTEIHQDPQIPPASSKVYNYGKAIVQDPEDKLVQEPAP